MRRVALLGVSGLLLLSGCGYSLVRTSGGLGDVHSVAVETPSNDSAEAGVEFLVADALRREFLQRGAVRLVENPATADLVLGGRVSSLQARARSLTSTSQALEYQVTLALDLEATRRDGRDVPLGARSLHETERYLASADAEAMGKNREEALRRLAQVLAGRVYDALYTSLLP
jgi:outer membrane lipopolysaccharide assembly protein LptE/RlpB